MALRFSAWIAAAALSCAIIWYGLSDFRPKKSRQTQAAYNTLGDWATERSSYAVERRLRQANDRLWVLTLRDSVLRQRVSESSDSLAVVIDPEITSRSSTPVDSVIRARWHALGITPVVPVTLAFMLDGNWSPGGLPRDRRYEGGAPIEVFLPSAETHGRCVALAHLTLRVRDQAADTRLFMTPETINALIGPCALIAQFGEPGPRIREWLRNAQWSTARFATWDSATRPWTDVVRRRSPYRDRAPNFLQPTDPAWLIRDFVAPSGVACLAHESDACRRTALSVPPLNGDTAWRDNVIAISGTNPRLFFLPRYVTALGPAEAWFVSEMVRTLGRDAFGRFWRSSLPVDSAFVAASGQTLDDWVRDWGDRTYGEAKVGPGVSAAGIASGTVVVLLGLWGSVVIERRRRVA